MRAAAALLAAMLAGCGGGHAPLPGVTEYERDVLRKAPPGLPLRLGPLETEVALSGDVRSLGIAYRKRF